MIDIEFYGRKIFGVRLQTRKEKAVTNAWKNYNNQLNTQYTPEQFVVWVDSCFNLFAKLLYEMSKTLGYDFDEVQIKRDCYMPIAHGDLEQDQLHLRKMLLEVLAGSRGIPVKQFVAEVSASEESASSEPS
jgi:hypothetical protein